MRSEELQDALGQVEDSLVEEADTMRSGAYKKEIRARNRARRRANIRGLAVIAACFCFLVTGAIMRELWSPMGSGAEMEMAQDSANGEEAMEAEAVKVLEIASWEDSETPSEQLADNKGVYGSSEAASAQMGKPEGFDAWTALSSVVYLEGAQGNVVYSPVNLYSMLALSGSIGSGKQQEAIFDLLQVKDLEELKRQYGEVWDLAGEQAMLANSLWLSDRCSYSEDALKSLSRDMKLSSYIGQMGSDELNQRLQEWVNDHTNNLLAEQAKDLATDDYELLTLVTTLYENAKWSEPFDPESTTLGDFRGKKGNEQAEYMHAELDIPYVKGDGYAACQIPTKDGGGMWIVLPDDGVDVDKLLKDNDVQNILQGNADSLDVEVETVVLSLPKFEYCNTMYAEDGLGKLGISSELIPDSRLFQFMETDKEQRSIPYVLYHSVCVKVDEQGVETAAMSALKEAADEGMATMYVNRPFLFSMVSAGNIPLCTGVMNDME